MVGRPRAAPGWAAGGKSVEPHCAPSRGAIGAVGVGIVVAALITPAATDRFGTTTWITTMLVVAGVAIAAFGLPFQRDLLVVGSFLLGLSSQCVKICVDTTVQQQVDERVTGRGFVVIVRIRLGTVGFARGGDFGPQAF